MADKCVPVEIVKPKKSGPGMLMGILMGSMIGAGVALLTAPRSGMETRQMIKDKGNQIKDQATSTVNDAKNRAQEAIRTGADKASELQQRGQATLQDRTSTVQNKVQSIVEGVKTGVKSYNKSDMETGHPTDELSRPLTNPMTGMPDTGTRPSRTMDEDTSSSENIAP